MKTKQEILKLVDKVANDIYQERGEHSTFVDSKSEMEAFRVAGLDLIYNYRMELQKRLEKELESESEPVEMYKCQSFIRGGKVENCTCGECF